MTFTSQFSPVVVIVIKKIGLTFSTYPLVITWKNRVLTYQSLLGFGGSKQLLLLVVVGELGSAGRTVHEHQGLVVLWQRIAIHYLSLLHGSLPAVAEELLALRLQRGCRRGILLRLDSFATYGGCRLLVVVGATVGLRLLPLLSPAACPDTAIVQASRAREVLGLGLAVRDRDAPALIGPHDARLRITSLTTTAVRYKRLPVHVKQVCIELLLVLLLCVLEAGNLVFEPQVVFLLVVLVAWAWTRGAAPASIRVLLLGRAVLHL